MQNPDWDRAFPWIESHLGGKITRIQRQSRDSGGRPAWFVDLDIDGAPRRVYARGTRDAAFAYASVYTTEREARILRVLHAEGLPVPEVLGFCPDPPVSLLEFVEGEGNFNRLTDPVARAAVTRHFVELLAQMHAVDPALIEAAGIERPPSPEAFALEDLKVWEDSYLAATREPVPLVTFTCDWLRRNAPRELPDVVLVQGDTGPGNFLFKDQRVTALLDFEMGHLGDPMDELAVIRSRDMYTPLDDIRGSFDLYAQRSGRDLDLAAIYYYTVKAMIVVPLSLAPVMENLNPRTEHAEWIAQYILYERTTPEALAEALGLELEPPELPTATTSPRDALWEIVEENLREEQLPAIDESYRASRLEMTLRMLTHLRNLDRWGPELEAQDLDDLGDLLGRRPATPLDGQRALDAFVRERGAEHEAELVRYFYRRGVRRCFAMRGALGMAEHAELTPIA